MPGVVDVSNSNSVPGKNIGDNTYRVEGTSSTHMHDCKTMSADYGFVNTYDIKMKIGRYFSVEHPSDTSAVVLNQAAVKLFGLKNPIGKQLDNGDKYTIIGVTDNFNYESLHKTVRPLVIRLYKPRSFGKYVSVRIKPQNFQTTIASMAAVWKNYAGNEAFDYNFLDQDLEHLYRAELTTSKVATTFSIIAIFIACLGLLGLAAFITEQRTKEIGIRKVLGASIPEIIFLLSKEFSKWVIIANVIAWPVAYYIMNTWLSSFAYRISIGFGIFILSGIIALFIALITVGTQTIKAAVANPVKSLRYE